MSTPLRLQVRCLNYRLHKLCKIWSLRSAYTKSWENRCNGYVLMSISAGILSLPFSRHVTCFRLARLRSCRRIKTCLLLTLLADCRNVIWNQGLQGIKKGLHPLSVDFSGWYHLFRRMQPVAFQTQTALLLAAFLAGSKAKAQAHAMACRVSPTLFDHSYAYDIWCISVAQLAQFNL